MLENVYYIFAGPILVVVALFGLRQISVLRDQMRQSDEQHRRVLSIEADRRAIDLGNRYIEEIAPRLRELTMQLEALRSSEFAHVLTGPPFFTWEDLPDSKEARDRLRRRLTAAVGKHWDASILDKLEALALQFNKEVASDSVGQALLGATIVDAVEWTWPFIALHRAIQPSAFDELIELYGRWASAVHAAAQRAPSVR